MFRCLLKHNLFRNNIPIRTLDNLYETRDFISKKLPIQFSFKNYYETEEFLKYKPNLKSTYKK